MASVAGSYSRAFADIVIEQRLDADRCIAELRAIAGLLRQSVALRRVWENPAVPEDQKHKLLDVIAKRDEISKLVRNLVAVVISHRRTQFLDAITNQLERELDLRRGFADAQISSARALNEAERQEFEKQVAKLTGKKVRARYSENAALLGGAVVRIGSTIYDGSVKGQLERIKQAISSS
ncbi:MAG TPA: ATP synthase F1 subunit delta [Candidatus Acidoferrum sp.]|nr:ATP synthase F1 subunit delta [Candidatus Acidoferrum sp.]